MNIPIPKYEVGHKFWVPRCRMATNYIEKEIDGETYRRSETVFVPYVKQKEIRSICITIDYRKKISVEYNCWDVVALPLVFGKKSFNLPQKHTEDMIENYSMAEAQVIADEYAESKQEYFGKKEEDIDDLYEDED